MKSLKPRHLRLLSPDGGYDPGALAPSILGVTLQWDERESAWLFERDWFRVSISRSPAETHAETSTDGFEHVAEVTIHDIPVFMSGFLPTFEEALEALLTFAPPSKTGFPRAFRDWSRFAHGPSIRPVRD